MKNNVDQIRAYQANFARNVKKVTTLSGVVLATASFLLLVQPQAAQAETTPATTVSQAVSAASQASAPATPASSASDASASSVAAPASASAPTSAVNSASSSASASAANVTSSTNSSEPALYKAADANTPTVATNPDVVANAVNTTSAPNIKTYTPSNNAGSVTKKGSYSTSADAIDVSSYQGAMSVNTYTNLKNQGVKYVIVKLTQGTTYVNPYAGTQIANAKAAGLTVYAYDYVTFTSTGAAQAEAAYFAAAARRFGLGKDTLMIADVEDDVVKRGDITSLLNAYWAALSAQGFTNHAVYTGYYFDQQYKVSSTVGKSRTWIAAYYYSYWKNTILNSGYGAWQYTDSFNGIDGSIDMGLFSSNVAKNGESYENGHWYLYQGGVKQTGFMRLTDGRVVYYNGAGQMQYGAQTMNGVQYYFSTWNGAMQTGQVTINGATYYYDQATGQRQTGLVYNAASKIFQYYDLKTGKLLTSASGTTVGSLRVQANGTVDVKTLTSGLNIINGERYYYNATTKTLVSGFVTTGGKTYYFDPTTKKAVTGQMALGGHWYGFSSDGVMQTGFTKLSDGRIVYYAANGQMQYGEKAINGHWYYLDTWDGHLVKGFTTLKDGRTVYYAMNGQMQYGFQKIGGKTYYLDTWDGHQIKNGEKAIDGHWYYFDANGVMATGFTKLKDGRTVYYNSNGQMLNGFQKINDKTYYFDTWNGHQVKNGEKALNGNWYYFDANGVMATGFTKLKDGRTVYYNSNGQMLNGFQKINGKTYYFDTWDGHQVKNSEKAIDGHWYYFDANGVMATSLVTLKDGRTVYYGADGQMKYGWQKINGKTYYFDTWNGHQVKNGEKAINGFWYYFNQNGIFQTGWVTLPDGRRVYYDKQGHMVYGTQTIDGKTYTFDRVTGALKN